jgi:hypothetical protein
MNERTIASLRDGQCKIRLAMKPRMIKLADQLEPANWNGNIPRRWQRLDPRGGSGDSGEVETSYGEELPVEIMGDF